MNFEDYEVCVGQESPKARMVTGWRRFFTRTFWRMQWVALWSRGRFVDVRAVVKLECPPGLEDLLP